MREGEPGHVRKRSSGSPALMLIALGIAVLLSVLVDDHDAAESGGESTGSEVTTAEAPAPAMDGQTRLDPVLAAPPSSLLQRERERIRAHLLDVAATLRARPAEGLTPEQRRNRARHLDVLREYAERQRFPRNLEYPGERVPHFVDDRGVRCAVGYLIHRDGRDGLVERIAATRNTARIPELADDPDLVAWLEEAGLTAEEAALIQPAYCGRGDGSVWCDPPEEDVAGAIGAGYAVASMAAGAIGGLSTGVSLARDPGDASRWMAAAGTAAGLTGLGLGAHGIAEGGDARTAGGLNVALGLLSTYVGVRTLVRGTDATLGGGVAADGGGGEHAPASRLTVVPIYAPGAAGPRGAGILVRVRR